VSQALERIRKVARERKKERFTALFHHISIDLLEEAFFELKEDAAFRPGRSTTMRWMCSVSGSTGMADPLSRASDRRPAHHPHRNGGQ
jgi:hypothetical protein